MAIDTGKAARLAFVGVEFSSPMIGGAIIGHYLDEYFMTAPYLTLVLFVVGVFLGFYRLVTIVSDWQKKTS